MIVIKINGRNTINHETIVRPWLHNILSKSVNIIITTNLIKARLYNFLNISIIICVIVNTIYNIAGGHNSSRIIYIYILFI